MIEHYQINNNMQRPRFIKPGADDTLYPGRNKDGTVSTLTNPHVDCALPADGDSRSSFVYNRHHHLPLDTQRQKLPIFQYRNHILYLLEKYQTLVLIGETGCGKSTQVPQYVHSVGHVVCVCEPRAAAASSLAARVASEAGSLLGEQVGYAASMTAVRSASSGIVFMTEGVLLREMFASPLLMQYSCIVLDEVHERSQMTDVLMGLLKKIAKKRKNLKIVVSSATMDAEFLKDFFNLAEKKEKDNTCSHTRERDKSTSVILSVQGRTHPVDIYYVEEPVPDYVKATVDTIIKIHENEPFGDVLAFLTSQEDILSAREMLQPYVSANRGLAERSGVFPSGVVAADMSVLTMYGALPQHRQVKVFQMADKNVRKVILATNIAETSVTIPGIVYVIDCGFHKLPQFSPALGVASISVATVSKNNAIQRAGRAGRTTRGKCYRLYTEESYESLPETVPPEMCRSDLSPVLLQLKALGIHNLLRFSFPTPPAAASLLSGIELLYALGAIDKEGHLTLIGSKMAELPLRPIISKMLCDSGKFGCIDEMLSIAAMLHVDSVFVNPSSGQEGLKAKTVRRNHFEVAEGDILMYLNIMSSYVRVRQTETEERRSNKICKEWCQRMYLNHNVMEKAFEIRGSLEKLIRDKFGIEEEPQEGADLGGGRTLRVMKCVTSGLFPQAASLSSSGQYRGSRGADLYISAGSCLYTLHQPNWVVFASVQCSDDRTYMRDLLTIDNTWLLELAPHYYTQI